MKIALLLANGFEEIEALTPLDYLRRAGASVDTIGIGSKTIVGSHNIPVIADITDTQADANDYDCVIFPGGMPGATNLDAAEFTDKIINTVTEKGGRLAAICAAPLVLGRRGLLKGKEATCYPGFENELVGAKITSLGVVTDGNITTAKGMGVALEFAKELTSLLVSPEESAKISEAIMEDTAKNRISFDLSVDEFKKIFNFSNLDDDDEFDEDDKLDVFDVFDDDKFDIADEFEIKEKFKKSINYESSNTDHSGYIFPSFELLKKGIDEDPETSSNEIQKLTTELLNVLDSFNIQVSINDVERGPTVTRFSILPSKGISVRSIVKLEFDIALALGVERVRIEAPIPGKSAIGIEVPNKTPSKVYIRDLIENDEFIKDESKTRICVGKAIDGSGVYCDISALPHVIIAGATGMGKSVCINSIITSILYKARPDEVKFILIDPKKVEYAPYAELPHLLTPIITEPKYAIGALMWAGDEMNKRYDMIEKVGVKNIDYYNKAIVENPSLGTYMPKIIICIDELNDLMVRVRNQAENLIMILAQKARAAGIHLVIGTQRPSVDVISGVIKANIPSRIACKVSTAVDSRTVLEQTGAEKLLGKGDMLVSTLGKSPVRVQGAFVSDSETEAIVNFIKAQFTGNPYDAEATQNIDILTQKYDNEDKDDNIGDDDTQEGGYLNDKKFLDAVFISVRNGSVATSFLQRKLHIGYGKAAQYIDIMEELGIVGEKNGAHARDVLITMEEWEDMLKRALES